MNAKDLAALAENLFRKKSDLNTLHQEIADNFYPERADFTTTRSIGEEFAANLTNSYPVLCRRDLGNQFGTMLRPTARSWFHPSLKFDDDKDKAPDNERQRYLQWFGSVMRKAMYDPVAMFTRATKEGDHDFAAFGQCAISIELNKRKDGLLYRCWHLRDMAWQENEEGQIGSKFRRWKPTALVLSRTFPGRVHESVTKLLDKTPFEEVEVMHMVVEADMYDDDARGRPRWSIWYDTTNEHLMEAMPIWGKHYVIPRWSTVSCSQYAYSPAVVAALPDARLLQAMTFTLLEAGEKATNPPMVATQDAVRSDVAIYAGGITWVDKEYDERMGEVLRPITQDFRGFNYGLQMAQDTRAMLTEAFYLNKLKPFNPATDPQMTAFQAGQIVQDYVRNALPIFEPMEQEYNAAICDETFQLMLRNGAFGSPFDWPKELQSAEMDFRFESPLHDAIEQQKGQKWLEAKTLIADAIAIDQSTAAIMDAKTALRDALSGIGCPAKWLNSEETVNRMVAEQQQQQQVDQILAAVEQGSSAAANLAGAQRDMAAAQAVA